MPSTLMLLTNPHRPDPRVLREARALAGAGVAVKLIAWDRDGGHPEHATEGPVEVHRVGPRCPFRSAGKVMSRLPLFWLKALSKARTMDYDFIHANDFDTLPLGMALSRLSGKPLVYDAHDLYARMVEKDVGALSGTIWKAELCMSSRADALITTSAPFAKALSQDGKVDVRIVTNSPDPEVLKGHDRAEVRRRHGLDGFVISYLGSLEPGRFVDELCQAFTEKDGVTVALAGNGTLRPAVEKAAKEGKVRFLGTLSTDEALLVTWASDLVVCMLDPSNPNYRDSIPVKILDAMATSRPVVTSQGLTMAEKVLYAGCGFVIPYDLGEFRRTVMGAKAASGTLDGMGRKGREYLDRELSWERSREELAGVYRALVGPA